MFAGERNSRSKTQPMPFNDTKMDLTIDTHKESSPEISKFDISTQREKNWSNENVFGNWNPFFRGQLQFSRVYSWIIIILNLIVICVVHFFKHFWVIIITQSKMKERTGRNFVECHSSDSRMLENLTLCGPKSGGKRREGTDLGPLIKCRSLSELLQRRLFMRGVVCGVLRAVCRSRGKLAAFRYHWLLHLPLDYHYNLIVNRPARGPVFGSSPRSLPLCPCVSKCRRQFPETRSC